MKKYYKSRKEAINACNDRKRLDPSLRVWRMPKGTRHHGEYAVCNEMEYLNTY